MIISPTLLALYKQCPQAALARVRDKQYSPMGRKGWIGSLTHAAIAHVLKHGMPDDMLQTCRGLIGESWQLNGSMSEAGIKLGMIRPIVENDIEPACETVLRLGYQIAQTEIRLDMPYGEHTLRGVIDAVATSDEGTVLIDWKTGRLYRDKILDQLTFYSWLWSIEHGYEPGQGMALNVFDGEMMVFNPPWPIEQLQEDIDNMVDGLEDAWSGEAERLPGKHCSWCPIADDCPKAQR